MLAVLWFVQPVFLKDFVNSDGYRSQILASYFGVTRISDVKYRQILDVEAENLRKTEPSVYS